MKKFCIFCRAETKEFFVCDNCFRQKKTHFENNVSQLDNKDQRTVVLLMKIAHFGEFLFFLFIGLLMFVSLIKMHPYVYRATARCPLELQKSIVVLYYFFNFSGFYFGIRFYQKFSKHLAVTPVFKIFEPNFRYRRFGLTWWGTADIYKRHIALLFRFWPVTLFIFCLVFFRSFSDLASLTRKIPILHPFVSSTFIVFMVLFATSFWVGLIFLGPSLFSFLYTDWWRSLLFGKKTKN